MKKTISIVIIVLSVAAIAAFIFYKLLLPGLVADAMVADELPAYVPKQIQRRIEEFRKPVNKSAEEMIIEMHKADIPVTKLVQTIEATSEKQAYALLDELAVAKPKNADEVFDIGKKYLPADYDVEVFREPFKEHINMKMINKAIKYASMNRRTKDIDIKTVKLVAKKILLEKEKEYNSKKTTPLTNQ